MLGVLDADETASAEDGALGLEQLNDLFAMLLADNIDLGYTSQNNLADDFPLDDSLAAQVKPILAMKLNGFYPAAVSQSVAGQAAGAMAQLRRNAVLENMVESSLTHIPLGRGGSYDIFTDE